MRKFPHFSGGDELRRRWLALLGGGTNEIYIL
nr:MAG TPA: hypothetical protein [Caudoviricetes sp.]